MKWQLLIGFVAILALSSCKKEVYELIWTELESPTDVRLNDVEILNTNDIMVVGGTRWQRGEFLSSFDGGANWTVDSIYNNILNELVINQNNIMAVGYWGAVLQYETSNMSWNLRKMTEEVELHSIAAQSLTNYTAVGGGSFDIGVMYHFDGLNREPDSSKTGFAHEMQDVCYLNATEVIAVGYGAVFKSYDSGRTWEAKPIQGEFFLTVHFPSPTVGYAAGFTGTIIKTTDGGESWKKLRNGNQLTNKREVFRDVLFTSIDKGYLVGDDGVFWITDDGGNSWKTVDGLPEIRLNAIAFANDVGFIVGDDGRIFKFED